MRSVITSKDRVLLDAKNVGGIPFDPDQSRDSYNTALLKLIPTEVIVFFLTIFNLLNSTEDFSFKDSVLANIAILLVAGLANFVFLRNGQNVKSWKQLMVSTLALFVWIYSFGGPFENLNIYVESIGSAVLVIYTFFAPLIFGIKPGSK